MYTIGGCGTELGPPSANPVAGISDAPGLGCVECGGSCGGLGALSMDGSGLLGTGIFGTGVSLTDFSTWTYAEMATIALGLYVFTSIINDVRGGARKVGEKVRGTRRKAGDAVAGKKSKSK